MPTTRSASKRTRSGRPIGVSKRPGRRARRVSRPAARAVRRRINYGRKRTSSSKRIARNKKRTRGSDYVDRVYEVSRVVSGKRPRLSLRNLKKQVASDLLKTTFRFSYLSDPSDAFGMMCLNYAQNNSADVPDSNPLYRCLPCHVYDLTSCLNYNNGVVGAYPPGLGLGQQRNVVAGFNSMFFTPLPGQNVSGNGIVSCPWQVETTDANATGGLSACPGAKSVLNWADIRLMLYGRNNQPTRFTVQLVQFDPDVIPDTSPASRSNAQLTSIDEFYEYLVKQYCSNPLNTTNSRLRKYMKVMYTKEIMIQPKDGDYANVPPPNCKELRIFKWLNRLCRYDWDERRQGTGQVPVTGTMEYNRTQGDFKQTVEPRARIYLMIRAQTQVESTSVNYATWSATAYNGNRTGVANTYPTYDIMIRTNHSVGLGN